MHNKDQTNLYGCEQPNVKTTFGHSGPKEDIEEEKPKPIIFRLRQEPRFNQIKLRYKKLYQMRRI